MGIEKIKSCLKIHESVALDISKLPPFKEGMWMKRFGILGQFFFFRFLLRLPTFLRYFVLIKCDSIGSSYLIIHKIEGRYSAVKKKKK